MELSRPVYTYVFALSNYLQQFLRRNDERHRPSGARDAIQGERVSVLDRDFEEKRESAQKGADEQDGMGQRFRDDDYLLSLRLRR